MPAAAVCAGSGRRRGGCAPAPAAATAFPLQAAVRRRRDRTFLLRETADCCAADILLAPISGETMPASASGVCEPVRPSTDTPDKWRPPGRARFHINRDTPAAAGGEAFDQPLQHLRARRMIVDDAVHQLPGLLHDLGGIVRLAVLRD